LRELSFEQGVPSRELVIGAQRVPECKVLAPVLVAELCERQVDEANAALEAPEVETARQVADRPPIVARCLEAPGLLGDGVQPVDGDHHVDDRLRRETGHRGAAVVLDRQCEPAERRCDPLPLTREREWPLRVVIDDDDVIGHVGAECAVRVCAVRLALMIEGQEGVTWDDWIALAETCEAHGVEALFRSDHYISMSVEERPVLDAWATLAALAARTTKLELGTLVSPATFRHPSVLARNAATADEVSGGRVTVGMGAGWMEREHDAYGFDFRTARERIARFAEQLEIVHGLLRRDHFTFDGERYRLQDAPGLNRPELPILVGGSARPGTAEPAVRFADEYNTLFATHEQLRERKRTLDEACERAGRDPTTLRRSVMAPCVIGTSDEEVRASAKRTAERFGRDADTVLERYGELGAVGTIQHVAERLRETEALGYERVMLQHLVHDDLETVALIGRELVPAVA
jgi:F420-dependent oxidoreductase-like protein